MYIGIHINNTFIAAATTDQNDNAILIKDESIESGKPFMNSLNIYIEDEFAYLSDKVNYLIANNYELNYAANFLNTLPDTETAVYKDGSGTAWNAAALIALFLKKLKTDIRVYNDTPIKGAVVTVTSTPNPSLAPALSSAFQMANIQLNTLLSIEKAAIEGYGIINTTGTAKNVLVFYLDQDAVTLSLNTLDEDDFTENTSRVSEEKFGERKLHEHFFMLLLKRYEQVTGKKVKENKRNFRHITTLVHELTNQLVNDTRLYIQLLCAVDDEVIELIVTRAQVNSIIKTYIQEIIVFLNEELLKNNTDATAVDIVLCAGDSRFFPQIEQQLKTLFHNEDQKIYNQYPEEVLTKGAALYANTIDKTADTPLTGEMITTKDHETQKQAESTGKDDENAVDISRLSRLIKAMNINAGCEAI